MSARPVPPSRMWWLGAGFVVWASALVFLYALHAIGCMFAWPTATLRVSLFVVLFVHVVAIGWMWRSRVATEGFPEGFDAAPSGAFLRTVVIWSLLAALAATLVTLAPPLLLSTCI